MDMAWSMSETPPQMLHHSKTIRQEYLCQQHHKECIQNKSRHYRTLHCYQKDTALSRLMQPHPTLSHRRRCHDPRMQCIHNNFAHLGNHLYRSGRESYNLMWHPRKWFRSMQNQEKMALAQCREQQGWAHYMAVQHMMRKRSKTIRPGNRLPHSDTADCRTFPHLLY